MAAQLSIDLQEWLGGVHSIPLSFVSVVGAPFLGKPPESPCMSLRDAETKEKPGQGGPGLTHLCSGPRLAILFSVLSTFHHSSCLLDWYQQVPKALQRTPPHRWHFFCSALLVGSPGE